MADPRPVIIEGKLEAAATARSIDITFPDDVQVTVQSSNAILIEQISKLTKRKLRVTFEIQRG